MTYYCLNKWNQNRKRLEAALRSRTDLNECGYAEIVKLVVKEVLNGGKTENDDYEEYFWDVEHITEADVRLLLSELNSRIEKLAHCAGAVKAKGLAS